MSQSKNEYDGIAEAYRDSKQLSFRKYIEEYTFFEILGDIRGATVLDLACGEGFYTRKIKQAGAAEVTGVDLSAEMIKLAEEEERLCPLGCKYLNRDVAQLDMVESVDVVVAMYLLNYARTKEELLNFVQVAYNRLRPGGRFIGFNDNVQHVPRGTISFAQYGFDKVCTPSPEEGDIVLYQMINEDGTRFEFKNYFLKPETYQWAFQKAGFSDFQWVGPFIHPSQQHNPFWDAFMSRPPLIGFSALKQ